MSVETKIIFYKNGEEKGEYFVYNGDCDGRDTFWCSRSEWDGVMKLQMVNNEILYFNSKNEEMFVFEQGEFEYDRIKSNINLNSKDSLVFRFINNKWNITKKIKRKKNKKINLSVDLQKEIKKLKEEKEEDKNKNILDFVNKNAPIKRQGCCIIKNPKETDFSDYEDIKNLKGYMINLKKKTVINKISKRIQKNVININKSKKYKRPSNFSITYEELIKCYC